MSSRTDYFFKYQLRSLWPWFSDFGVSVSVLEPPSLGLEQMGLDNKSDYTPNCNPGKEPPSTHQASLSRLGLSPGYAAGGSSPGGALGCRPDGGYLWGMHINWGFLYGRLQFGGVMSGGFRRKCRHPSGPQKKTSEPPLVISAHRCVEQSARAFSLEVIANVNDAGHVFHYVCAVTSEVTAHVGDAGHRIPSFKFV